jgi:hypothetical protein
MIAAWIALALAAGQTPEARDTPWLVAQAKSEPDLSARQLPAKGAKTIAVLLISGEEIGLAISEIYAGARSVIEANTSLNVAPLDVISLDERAAAIRQCAGRGACFAERVRSSASASNVGLLLTVSADRLDEGYLLGFRLVDVETAKDIGAAGDEVPTGMSLLGAMEQQIPGVFPKELWGQVSSVQIDSDPPNAEVTIGGRSCVSPCEMTRMPPGEYEVTVRKQGYLPWTGMVTLVPKEAARVTTSLSEPAGGITSEWWFWTLLGAVVIGGATAAIVATRPTDRVVTLCIASPEKQGECLED